ncbi:hypothetical protein [Embleya sp. NBC_00896]|uniref:hypothetical protein n=1 Tax=Embleya sp. NBC_00896 TaxID=2975961 RepID=UPI00386A19D6|nr:hypothetical protein OG928_46055 [Embleya sp. NBC_00896]
MARLKEDWQGAPTYIRVVSWVSVLCGVLALVGCVVWDLRFGWGHLAYVPNVFSSLTGLLFGVPFALFVLNALGKDQAERSEQRAVLVLARQVADDFHRTVQSCIRPSAEASIASLVTKADEFYEHAVTNTVAARTRPGRGVRARQVSTDVWEQALTAGCAFVEQVAAATNLSTSKQAARWAAMVESEWRFLDRDIRVRLVAAGCPWLDRNLAQTIRLDVDILAGDAARCLYGTRHLIAEIRSTRGRSEPSPVDVEALAQRALQSREWAYALAEVIEKSKEPADFWPAN